MIEFIKILPRRVRQSERFCDWCEIKFKKKNLFGQWSVEIRQNGEIMADGVRSFACVESLRQWKRRRDKTRVGK